jgi:hypothetical protein
MAKESAIMQSTSYKGPLVSCSRASITHLGRRRRIHALLRRGRRIGRRAILHSAGKGRYVCLPTQKPKQPALHDSGNLQPSAVASPAGAAAGSHRRAWPGAEAQRRAKPRCQGCCDLVRNKAHTECKGSSRLTSTIGGSHGQAPSCLPSPRCNAYAG